MKIFDYDLIYCYFVGIKVVFWHFKMKKKTIKSENKEERNGILEELLLLIWPKTSSFLNPTPQAHS